MKTFYYILLTALLTLQSKNATSNDNQHIIASTFPSSDYYVAKIEEQYRKKISYSLPKRTWPVEIKKVDSRVTEIFIKRAGIIDEIYQPDVKNYPAYFYQNSVRITFYDGMLIYYNWSKNNATIKYILSPTKEKLNSIEKEKIVESLEKYILSVFKNQSEARSEMAAEKANQVAKEQAKYSIKDKPLKNLKIQWVNLPDQISQFSKIDFAVLATLEDGTVLKTEKLGGKTRLDDFEISCSGGDVGDNSLMIKADAKEIPDDIIRLKIKSKYHNISITKTLKVDYNYPLTVNYNGQDGCGSGLYSSSGGGGGNGKPIIIYAEASYNKQDNAPLHKIEIKDYYGKVLQRFKLQYGVELM